MSSEGKPRRRLSIRSMMLVIVVLALLLAPLAWVKRNRERALLAEFARAESSVVQAIKARQARENEDLRLKIKAIEQAKEPQRAKTGGKLQND
jgi:hypothetical protein